MALPFWAEMVFGFFEIATVLVVIALAHLIVKAKGVAGVSMLVCVYISVFAAIFSTIISIEVVAPTSKIAFLIFSLEAISSVFAFFASIHALRFVRASQS